MKKCRVCGNAFEPRNTLQVACSVECAIAGVRSGKRDGKKPEFPKPPKTRQKAIQTAQAAFNAYIRARDEFARLPCVSCGRFHAGQWHAGHYRTTRSAGGIRYGDPEDEGQRYLAEMNCWRQCAPCNNHKSGDIVNYRLTLLRRIGPEALEAIEGFHESRRWTVEDCERIAKYYRAKTREIVRAVREGDDSGAPG